jgi:ankyrin repeat protein
MYPNPQEALPLPSRPSVEQYKKLAKDLVKSCRSGAPDAIHDWTARWLRALAALQQNPSPQIEASITGSADEIEQFARKQLTGNGGRRSACALADAQFVIARAHGFLSWPKFVKHIESLVRESSVVSRFEAAASAIVSGDAATLQRLLREHSELIRARSTREHRATLLHYVSANGVEGYRQISPKNSAEIAEILLAAGAEVDAEADVYGGGCTTLGLVATSGPPDIAGVQLDVIDVLLEHGARMDGIGSAGNKHALINACLANGQPAAAAYLVSRGAPLDFVGAAGLGRVDVLTRFFDSGAQPGEPVTNAQVLEGFSLACAYGREDAVRFFLDHGIDVDAELRGHGEGHTGLHVAAFHGHLGVVDTLLKRGARVDAIAKRWPTPPLLWALTGWTRKPSTGRERYYAVVARLIEAGATPRPDVFDWDAVRHDPRMLAALEGRTPLAPGGISA